MRWQWHRHNNEFICDGDRTGTNHVGGLVGSNAATLTTCYATTGIVTDLQATSAAW